MSGTALKEPAILYLIFRELTQVELLGIQAVCTAWRRAIQNDKRLLAILWLHPSPTTSQDEPRVINPLLRQAFPDFFGGHQTVNFFVHGGSNLGPWLRLVAEHRWPDLTRFEKYKHPEASWRKMIPCYPSATQLQVELDREYHGKGGDALSVAWLRFSNKEDDRRPASRTHPPWLTFGLIYDIIEAAYFRNIPEHGYYMKLDFSGEQCRVSERAPDPDKLRRLTQPHPGVVRLNLITDPRSAEELLAVRAKAIVKSEKNQKRNDRYGWCGTSKGRKEMRQIFTDEFRFEDAVSYLDIEWDHVYEHDVPPEEVPHEERRGRKKRMFLGVDLDKLPEYAVMGAFYLLHALGALAGFCRWGLGSLCWWRKRGW